MITGSLGYSCAAFIQMGLSSSSSASAAAAAQRMHHRAFRTASLPPNALKQQQAEALKATQPPTRHASITSKTFAESSTTSNGPIPKPLLPPKRVFVVRHGQAQHNPRAEAAREAGCSFDEFLRLMELDDAYDADLTSLGESQAQTAGERHALSDIEMVVSSPLSRALKTADLVHPPESSEHPKPRRIAIENFREINGKLLNAQRRPRADLEQKFPHWCFQQIPPLDLSWTEELETREDCSERGYRGLLWVLEQPEQNVLLVAHGGLLNYMMNGHDNVVLVDGRQPTNNGDDSESEARCITKRFGNCELREFIITAWDPASSIDNCTNKTMEPVITLEEVTLSIKL